MSPSESPQSEQPESDSSEPPPSSASVVFRAHVAGQVASAVTPQRWDDETRQQVPQNPEKAEKGEPSKGALAAWAGLTDNGDPVEEMIVAQMVTTHDLSMAALSQAINRANEFGYFGGYIHDASKISRLILQQIETLARYRTWRRREAMAASAAGAST